MFKMKIFSFVSILFYSIEIDRCSSAGIMDQILFAVNCGGEAHTDSHGIRYRKDYLKTGIASDYGRNSFIRRVPKEDMIIYQTERYDLQTFSYEIPLNDDGDFVLWLKFSEVWFNDLNMKVFQILLNDEHILIDELDIFAKVGRSTAHDEYFPFQIKNGRLIVKSRSSSYSGLIKVTFQRLDHRDNPKVNAIILWKGFLDQIPKLSPMETFQTIDDQKIFDENRRNDDEDEEEDEEYLIESKEIRRNLKTSGPKVVDPYAEDHSSSLISLLIAIVALIPILICLCRL